MFSSKNSFSVANFFQRKFHDNDELKRVCRQCSRVALFKTLFVGVWPLKLAVRRCLHEKAAGLQIIGKHLDLTHVGWTAKDKRADKQTLG